MEWHYEPATLIPVEIRTEHVNPDLSQVGISTRNLCHFLTFVGASATRLRPDIEAITAWCRNAIEPGAHHHFQTRPSSVPA
jgi:hypothetical protein